MRSETHVEDLALALAGLVEQFRLKNMTEVPPTDWSAWQLLTFLTAQIHVEQSEVASEDRQRLMNSVLSGTRSASDLEPGEVLQFLYQLARNERAGASGNPEGASFFWRFLSSPAAEFCLGTLVAEVNRHLAQVDPTSISDALQASAIFHMSLSSRELFHSNFLGWLIQRYPSCLANILPTTFSISKIESVDREKLNLDLLIRIKTMNGGDGLIVIENKVKDAPKPDQLKRYDQKIEHEYAGIKAEKFLLSLVPPSKAVADLDGWRSIDYGTLGLALRMWVDAARLADEDRIVIDLYGRTIRTLSRLIGVVFADEGLPLTRWIVPSKTARQKQIESVLSDLRLSDTLAKLQASIVLDEVREKLPQEFFEGADFKLHLDYGLTNKSPLVDAVLVRSTSAGELRLGVQVQGDQYRHFVEFDGFKIPHRKSAKAKIDSLREQIDRTDGFRWLISPTVDSDGWITPRHPRPEGPFSGKLRTTMKPSAPINSYAPHFVYQYVNLIDANGTATVDLDGLPNMIAEDLHYAAMLLSDQRYIDAFNAIDV